MALLKKKTRIPAHAEENYRQTALFLARTVRERSVPGFVFASATHGEGTTTTVLEVARQMRDAFEMRPLVVQLKGQSDSKRPSADTNEAHQGLIGLSNGSTLAECVTEGPYDLPLIARATPNGDGMTGRVQSAMMRILREQKPSYNVLLVDAPPLLSNTDTMAVCQLLRNVVIVVAAGKTHYEQLQRIEVELRERDVSIVGTVLNKHTRIIPEWFYKAFLQ